MADAVGIDESRAGTQTAMRSLRVLTLLAESSEPMMLRDIVHELGITSSAAHRLLAEFVRQSLVTRTPDNRYHIGPAMVALAGRILQDQPLRIAARPLLEAIAQHTTETVALHMRAGEQRVCLDTVESPHPIRRVISLGQTLPLYLGPASKAILAYLPPDEQSATITQAEAAGFDAATIRRQLKKIRTTGYIAAVNDHMPGVGGMAFAVIRNGEPVAAIAVSGPADRWSIKAMNSALPVIRELCTTLRGWSTTINGP